MIKVRGFSGSMLVLFVAIVAVMVVCGILQIAWELQTS